MSGRAGFTVTQYVLFELRKFRNKLKEFAEFSVLESLPKQSSFICIYNNKRSEFCTMVTNESVQYKVKKETVRETLQVRKTKQRTGATIKKS